MIKTTKEQRVALYQVWQRHMQPESKIYFNVDWSVPRRVGTLTLYQPNGCGNVPDAPTYRQWRRESVSAGPGCIMASTKRDGIAGGMWLGIEPDGYTHS